MRSEPFVVVSLTARKLAGTLSGHMTISAPGRDKIFQETLLIKCHWDACKPDLLEV